MNKIFIVILIVAVLALVALVAFGQLAGAGVKNCGKLSLELYETLDERGEVLQCFNEAFLECKKARMEVELSNTGVSLKQEITGETDGDDCKVLASVHQNGKLLLHANCFIPMVDMQFIKGEVLNPEKCDITAEQLSEYYSKLNKIYE